MLKKIAKKIKKNCAGPPPTPELHIRIVKKKVHGFEEKSKFHVPGYMDLKKKQNIMYRVHGFEKQNTIRCTGVHESEKK
jgi:hypothetical protein